MNQIRIFISNKRLGIFIFFFLLFLSLININLNYMKIIVAPIKSKIGIINLNYDYNVVDKSTPTATTQKSLPLCSDLPISMVGPVSDSQFAANLDVAKVLESYERKLFEFHNDIAHGGLWTPRDCNAVHRVAVIVPFRDRASHLIQLFDVIIPILKRQRLQFQIFVVEQIGNDTFNKGRIMNSGFQFVKNLQTNFKCFIFHDVDLIPEDDRNMYTCDIMPKHMSPAVSSLQYILPYDQLVGGVLALRDEHFERANGYSNSYWGWGGEDDDFFYRLENEKFIIERPPMQIGRYKMLPHDQRPREAENLKLLTKVQAIYKVDGLLQTSEIGCKIVSVVKKPLYTHIFVDVGQKPVVSNESDNKAETNETEIAISRPTPGPNIWLLVKKF